MEHPGSEGFQSAEMMIKYSISLGRGFSICFSICFSQVRIISYLVNLNDLVKRDATDATDATDPEALEDDAIPQAELSDGSDGSGCVGIKTGK